jgi:hypothetical protein
MPVLPNTSAHLSNEADLNLFKESSKFFNVVFLTSPSAIACAASVPSLH